MGIHRDFEHNRNQIQLCNISGDVFIDAGCGDGTYTFPLATMVKRVIAIDKNPSNISYVNSRKILNVEAYVKDFLKEELYHKQVEGLLYAFSLHYTNNPLYAIKNGIQSLKETGSELIIFEYTRSIPVPWVPHPIPLNKMNHILNNLTFKFKQLIFKDNRYYIIKIIF